MKKKPGKLPRPKANTLVLSKIKNPHSLDELVQSLASEVSSTAVRETVWDLIDQGKIKLTWDRKLIAG
jgi:hypothetical protein